MTVHLVIDSALGDLLLAGEESGSTGGGCVPAPVSTTGRANAVSVQPGRERASAAFDGSRKKSESAYRPGRGAPGTGVARWTPPRPVPPSARAGAELACLAVALAEARPVASVAVGHGRDDAPRAATHTFAAARQPGSPAARARHRLGRRRPARGGRTRPAKAGRSAAGDDETTERERGETVREGIRAAAAPDIDRIGPGPAVEEAAGGQPGLLALGSTLALGAVLALLSTTIVAVGMGRLSEEFSSPLSTVQWVSTGYLLALAVAIPVAGWAMERFGSKTLWQAALALYTAGCASAALAPSIGLLIGARVVQGFGAAMFEPIMLAVLAAAAGPKRVTTVMSLVQIPITLAPVFGPMVGGLLIDHLGRQWLFWFNVPLGLLCAVMAHFVLPTDPPRSKRAGSRLDVTGLALLPAGLAGLLLGFSEIANSGGIGSAAVWLPLLIGAVTVAGYVVHALRTTGVPLIDVRLFTTGRFGASVAGAFLFGASVYGAMFLLPLFFQQAGGHSAWDAGLLLAPQGIGTVLVLPMVGRLAARLGPRTVVLAGMAVSALGTFAYTQADPGKDTTLLVISLLIRGVGLATTLAPALAAGFAAVAPVNTGRAAAALIASIQLGGSAGTALLAVVVQQQLTDRLGKGGARASTATSPDLAAPLTAAFETAFWWTLGICALGAVAALFLPGPERGAEAEAEA